MTIDRNYILSSVEKLDNWVERNGWYGYDPYDIKEIKFVRKITDWGNNNHFMEIVREIIFELFYSFPVIFRKIFFIKPQINPKSMALFSKAYLDLFLVTRDEKYLIKSIYCIDWLEKNPSKTAKGIGWGYPFDWQSQALVPRYTPNGIVTTAAGDAFWSWYQYSENPDYLEVCKNICEFLISLPIDSVSEDKICFAYTPLSQNHIHNLNLFVAEFLIKIGQTIKNNDWVELGYRAVNYTIANQYDNGAFDYNGPPEKPKKFIDNYHTGFVLRMLHSIWNLTGREDVFESMKKCYLHYISNFFEDKKIPKLLPERTYRVDIHSCAESINCLTQLSDTFSQGLEIAKNIAEWTIRNLQDEEGFFYYGLLKSRITKKVFISKIAYLRWGQAWMMKGLSNYLRKCGT